MYYLELSPHYLRRKICFVFGEAVLAFYFITSLSVLISLLLYQVFLRVVVVVPITKNAKNTISVAYPPHISITQPTNYPRGYVSHQRHHNQQIIPSWLPHQPQPCIQSQRDRDRRHAKENDSHGQGIHPAGMNGRRLLPSEAGSSSSIFRIKI